MIVQLSPNRSDGAWNDSPGAAGGAGTARSTRSGSPRRADTRECPKNARESARVAAATALTVRQRNLLVHTGEVLAVA